ncbi:MAG: hypothetical protein EAZ85_06035 [Bacteroidetes bacterium]|nr:MAG: hypothetical protein EAZ85_06035 [Bacteroidota bacterium]TAG89802.1 MAG: hypothetical protein EAZ20_05670 [Bacteroidota bacterium]
MSFFIQLLQKNIFIIIFFVFILALNIFVRGSQIGFFDYDSVKNFTIIQEFQRFQFQNIFHHASPFFYVFMFLGNIFFSFDMLMMLTHAWAICVWIMLAKPYFLKKRTIFSFDKEEDFFSFFREKQEFEPLPLVISYFLYILYGFVLIFSHFLWVSGEYFGMESLSLVISGYLFMYYFKTFSIISPKDEENTTLLRIKKLQISVFLLGLLYTLNYKAIMLLPIFLCLECYQKVRFFSFKKWLLCLLIFFIPILFFITLSIFLGVSFLQYPRVIIFTFLMSSGEKVGFGSQFLGFSFFYYFWLACYENTIFFITFFIICFILFIRVYMYFNQMIAFNLNFYYNKIFYTDFLRYKTEDIYLKKTKAMEKFEELENEYIDSQKSRKVFFIYTTTMPFWFLVSYFFFAFSFFMSYFPTAPRGLVFVYPFYFLFFCIIIRKIVEYFYQTLQNDKIMPIFFKGFFLIFIGFVFPISLVLYSFFQNYSYYFPQKNTYIEIAKYLHEHKIDAIATSQSLQILPYTQKYGIKVYPLRHQNEIQKISKEVKFVLLDDYCEVLNKKSNFIEWQDTSKNKLIKTWDLPSLKKPLLFFEHSEFTKLSFYVIQNNFHHLKLEAKLIQIKK